ncbi:hypothetical protein KY290_010918 [Solanum tuberosum]|uniref:Uncharacterized protein n=1 Tax=Solanum tuberosum TaxID=4113 RepID=A0ABQ7VZ68_SOLTU|nr:hypothetical protein KY290_010918 [Solanum tuberosum]
MIKVEGNDKELIGVLPHTNFTKKNLQESPLLSSNRVKMEEMGKIPNLGSVMVKIGHRDRKPLIFAIVKNTEATHHNRKTLVCDCEG